MKNYAKLVSMTSLSILIIGCNADMSNVKSKSIKINSVQNTLESSNFIASKKFHGEKASAVDQNSSDVPTIGYWTGVNGERIPLKAVMTIVQGNGDFLIPRGDNFIESSLVNLQSEYQGLRQLTGRSITPNGGLEQPDVSLVNVPPGFQLKWIVDETYLVIGYGIAKVGANLNIRTYESREDAQRRIDELRAGASPDIRSGENNSTTTVPEIGSWTSTNGERIPLKVVLTIVQGDGDFLIPRGDNFIFSSLVSLDSRFEFLKQLTGRSITPNGGLEQPEVSLVNVPPGYSLKWIVDETYKVIGYGLARNGANLPIPVYNSRSEAQRRIDELNGNSGNTGGEGYLLNGTNDWLRFCPTFIAETWVNVPQVENYFGYQQPTHAILMSQAAYDSGKQTLGYLKVTGKNTGRVYVETNQKQTAIRDDMVGNNKYGNNHPMNVYGVGLEKDGVIKMPKTEVLRFTWVNKGTTKMTAELYNPNPSPVKNVNFRHCLNPGESISFEYDPNYFSDLPIWHQDLKGNMNSFNDCV